MAWRPTWRPSRPSSPTATLQPEAAQLSPVWVTRDGDDILFSTTVQDLSQKYTGKPWDDAPGTERLIVRVRADKVVVRS